MLISDWSSDVCSSDLTGAGAAGSAPRLNPRDAPSFEFADDPVGHLVIEAGASRLGIALAGRAGSGSRAGPALAARARVGCVTHRSSPAPPKTAHGRPGKRGWAAPQRPDRPAASVEIGRASWRGRVCHYVLIPGVADSSKKKKNTRVQPTTKH